MPVEQQPVAIVTGASRGIGAATAAAFSDAGYRVALVATAASSLDSVAASLSSPALALAGDLERPEFVDSIVPHVVAEWGRVDVLVNNAAWRELASMRRISRSSWNRTLSVCLTAPAFLARAAAAEMERSGHGVIVNVSSIMAEQAAGTAPAYIACKGALDALTYELASLYGPSGLRVVGIQPGAIDTEMSRDVVAAEELDELRTFSEDMIMLGRWGRSEEIARFILFVASGAASYLTGVTIPVDGGWLRQHFPLSLKRTHFPDDFK